LKKKYFLGFPLACLLLAVPIGLAQQQRAGLISLIQLIASPEKFDGKLVTVQGLLRIGEHPEFFGQQPMLYLHDEDAKNLLFANAVWLTPTDEMRRDREKLDRMYVEVTGLFGASHSGDNYFTPGTISQIRACIVRSDPNHPVGLKQDNTRYK
jgi:hypothetical protein